MRLLDQHTFGYSSALRSRRKLQLIERPLLKLSLHPWSDPRSSMATRKAKLLRSVPPGPHCIFQPHSTTLPFPSTYNATPRMAMIEGGREKDTQLAFSWSEFINDHPDMLKGFARYLMQDLSHRKTSSAPVNDNTSSKKMSHVVRLSSRIWHAIWVLEFRMDPLILRGHFLGLRPLGLGLDILSGAQHSVHEDGERI